MPPTAVAAADHIHVMPLLAASMAVQCLDPLSGVPQLCVALPHAFSQQVGCIVLGGPLLWCTFPTCPLLTLSIHPLPPECPAREGEDVNRWLCASLVDCPAASSTECIEPISCKPHIR